MILSKSVQKPVNPFWQDNKGNLPGFIPCEKEKGNLSSVLDLVWSNFNSALQLLSWESIRKPRKSLGIKSPWCRRKFPVNFVE